MPGECPQAFLAHSITADRLRPHKSMPCRETMGPILVCPSLSSRKTMCCYAGSWLSLIPFPECSLPSPQPHFWTLAKFPPLLHAHATLASSRKPDWLYHRGYHDPLMVSSQRCWLPELSISPARAAALHPISQHRAGSHKCFLSLRVSCSSHS